MPCRANAAQRRGTSPAPGLDDRNAASEI